VDPLDKNMTTLAYSETTLAYSETTLAYSETTLAYSETTLAHSETTLAYSKTTLAYSQNCYRGAGAATCMDALMPRAQGCAGAVPVVSQPIVVVFAIWGQP